MNFQKEIPFIEPPKRYRGILIIESDDGGLGDYTHWLPILKSKKQKTQWFPFEYKVGGSTALLANRVGTEGYMTVSQIHELVANGWEMMNHGKNHAGLAHFRITEDVSIGTTTFVTHVNGVNSSYEYVLKDSVTSSSEIIKPQSVEGTTVVLESPLKNNYTINSTLTLTAQALDEEINGGLDMLLDWGLDVKHHVAPYHYLYSDASEKIKERHLTSRTSHNRLTNTLPIANLYGLSGNLDGSFDSDSEIKSFVDQIYDEDSIGLFYGHSFPYPSGDKLDKLVDYAIEKGVRIANRHEAYLLKMAR